MYKNKIYFKAYNFKYNIKEKPINHLKIMGMIKLTGTDLNKPKSIY